MRKYLFACLALFAVVMLTSCYKTEVCVGDMKTTEPCVKINSVHNAHYIGGLIGTSKSKGKLYVDGAQNYKIRTYHSFMDYVVAGLTLNIYTPTTTSFYVPLKSLSKKQQSKYLSKKKKYYDDDEEDEDDE